jgi:hypothetical protein
MPGGSESAVFAGTLHRIPVKRPGLQKKMKNGDSVLTPFGKSLIVPPAIRLLQINSPKT